MKKLLLLYIVATITGTAAFAQLASGNRLGMRGLYTLVPLEWQLVNEPAEDRETDDDLKSGLGGYWGGHYGRISFNASGQYNSIGYYAQLVTDNGIVQIEGASVWFKPFPWMRILAGRGGDGALVGRIIPNNLHLLVLRSWSRTTGIDGGWEIFYPFDLTPGVSVSLTPIQNLHVGMALPAGFGGISTESTVQLYGGETAKNVFSRFQGAVGYTINNVGLARFQFVGKPEFDMEAGVGTMIAGARYNPYYQDFSRLEAAFALTAIKGLLLDVGIKYALPVKVKVLNLGGIDVAYNPGILIAAGLNLNMGDMGLTFIGSGHFGNNYSVTGNVENSYSNGSYINLHMSPSYRLGSAGTVGMNLGLETWGKETHNGSEVSNTGKTDFGIGAWFMRPFGGLNSHIMAGVTYTYIGVKGYDKRDPDTVSGYFRIPVLIEVNLF
jgi:hypothetical protein